MSWTWIPDNRATSDGSEGEYRPAFWFCAFSALLFPFYVRHVVRQALTDQLGKEGPTVCTILTVHHTHLYTH
jgi:hypothetical protein